MPTRWRLLAVLIAALWIVGCLPSGPVEVSDERVSRDDLAGVLLGRRTDEPVLEAFAPGSVGEAAASLPGPSFRVCEPGAGRAVWPVIARITGSVSPRGPPAIA